MAARNEYRACKQGGFESLITYRERFDAATKSYKDQGNASMTDQDVAIWISEMVWTLEDICSSKPTSKTVGLQVQSKQRKL